MFYHSLSV